MDMIPLKPERKLQLEEYASRHGQNSAAALAVYLGLERPDYADAVKGDSSGL